MSLIWFDSMDYRSSSFLNDAFPSQSGWSVGADHPLPERSGVSTSTGSMLLPASNPGGLGSESCFIGLLLTVDSLPDPVDTFLHIRAPSTQPQAYVRLRDAGGGLCYLEVWTGNLRERLLISSALDLSSPRYVELEVKISTSGRVRLAVDGVTDSLAEGVNSQFVTGSTWHDVVFEVTSSDLEISIADVYLASGANEWRPIGRSAVSLLWPWQAKQPFQWAPTPRPRVVVMAGQNNINGRGALPYTGTGRNPNSVVKIWNVEKQVFEALDAHVNTGNAFWAGHPSNIFGQNWGPEMRFAEEVTLLFKNAGYNDAEVLIVKLAEDTSWVTPAPGVNTWHPTIPGNLSDSALTQIDNAVVAAGGWGVIDSLDFFWHQGESESLSMSVPDPRQLYLTYTQDVFDHFETNIPVPIHWHRTVMHSGSFFLATDSIVNAQRLSVLPGTITETSDLQLQPDQIHLTLPSYDKLGYRYYLKWLDRLLESQEGLVNLISDQLWGSAADDDAFESSIGTPAISFDQLIHRQFDMLHAPALALQAKTYRESDAAASLEMSVGGVALPSLTVGSDAAWTFNLNMRSGYLAPEKVTGSVSFELNS